MHRDMNAADDSGYPDESVAKMFHVLSLFNLRSKKYTIVFKYI